MTIAQITTLLGWCSVINLGFLLFTTIVLKLMGGWARKIHAKMFGIDEADVARAYFQYLAQYKIVTLVFNVVPYIVLKITT